PPPEMMRRLHMAGGPGGQPGMGGPPGMAPPGMGPPKPMPMPKNYDLRKGQYTVEITVGKSFATQREENQDMLRSIIESAPGLTPMLADLLIEQIDTPIARRAAARLRKMNHQAKDEQEGEPESPAQIPTP